MRSERGYAAVTVWSIGDAWSSIRVSDVVVSGVCACEMDCLWWVVKLWSWKSFSVCGSEWFRDVGLLLVFGFGIMVLQQGLQLRCLMRFVWGLVAKAGELVSGVCSKLDFGDVWDVKLWSCGKCLWGFCRILILQLHDSQVCDAANAADLSELFFDCEVYGGDGDENDDESGLFCEFKGCYGGCSDDGGGGGGGVGCEDGVSDMTELREMLKWERQRAETAVVELEKERLAVASATEEAMAMILRLQNEKSLVEIEAHNYKKMAEQKILYDQETIQSLRLLLLERESERRLLQERLRLCRQKLKLYSQETEELFEGLDATFSDLNMDDRYELDDVLLELYS